jgi:hypothetical protein
VANLLLTIIFLKELLKLKVFFIDFSEEDFLKFLQVHAITLQALVKKELQKELTYAII